jgi:hypothetical protein
LYFFKPIARTDRSRSAPSKPTTAPGKVHEVDISAAFSQRADHRAYRTAAADVAGCFTPAKVTKRTPNEAADFGRRLSGTAFAHPWHADNFKERKEL